MADRLTVDLEGLESLETRLRRVKADLDAAGKTLAGQEGALGDPHVAGALNDFEEHWRDGRKKVAESAEALSTMVSEAIKAYRSTDEGLGKGIEEMGRRFATRPRPPINVPAERP